MKAAPLGPPGRLDPHHEDPRPRRGRRRAMVPPLHPGGGVVTATINPRVASFQLHIGRSPVHGFGVFADEVIPAGKRIIEYTGERIARREAVKRWDPKQASYLFRLDSYWRIDGAVGGSGAEFVNHSCEPNIMAVIRRGTIHFFSKRRIKRGEELTLDYKYSPDLERLPCRCGARSCRGVMNSPRQATRNA